MERRSQKQFPSIHLEQSPIVRFDFLTFVSDSLYVRGAESEQNRNGKKLIMQMRALGTRWRVAVVLPNELDVGLTCAVDASSAAAVKAAGQGRQNRSINAAKSEIAESEARRLIELRAALLYTLGKKRRSVMKLSYYGSDVEKCRNAKGTGS
ncbi:hypothetical protein QR680_006058 [Steinernema hermaphroditum]|uniref:Uncharacterized protein n=1 Tax=Steinernema hermaphroditum TaxID=289476 RepID=A0AA39LWR0_9BILA|nr:hypothetical protein QR680_006058 [Steinernema hermaphroditum]